ARAEVGTVAERQVWLCLPAEIQAVRVGEGARVAVGRPERHEHLIALADDRFTEKRVASGHPGGELNRAVVAQGLLDGRGRLLVAVAEFSGSAGVAVEGGYGVADKVRGCPVPGGQQQLEHEDDLVSLQDGLAARVCCERRHQVRARMVSPLGDQGHKLYQYA